MRIVCESEMQETKITFRKSFRSVILLIYIGLFHTYLLSNVVRWEPGA